MSSFINKIFNLFEEKIDKSEDRPSDWQDFTDAKKWQMYFKNKELKKKYDKLLKDHDEIIYKLIEEEERKKLSWDSDEYKKLLNKRTKEDDNFQLNSCKLFEEFCDNSFYNLEQTLHMYTASKSIYFVDVLLRFINENRLDNLSNHDYWKLIIGLWRSSDNHPPNWGTFNREVFKKWKIIFLKRNPVSKYKRGLKENFRAYRCGSHDGFCWTLSKNVAEKYQHRRITGASSQSKLNLSDKNHREFFYENLKVKFQIHERVFNIEDAIFYHNNFGPQPDLKNGIHEVIIIKDNFRVKDNSF